VRFLPLAVFSLVEAAKPEEEEMKKTIVSICALAVAILAVVPGMALAKLAANHNQADLRV